GVQWAVGGSARFWANRFTVSRDRPNNDRHLMRTTLLPRALLDRLAGLISGLLQEQAVLRIQAKDVVPDPDGAFAEEHCQEDTRGQVRPRNCRVTPVPVVQRRPVVLAEKTLPG